MAGKGDKTSSRTNWKRWNKSKGLPERVVKTWPRDNQGNLVGVGSLIDKDGELK